MRSMMTVLMTTRWSIEGHPRLIQKSKTVSVCLSLIVAEKGRSASVEQEGFERCYVYEKTRAALFFAVSNEYSGGHCSRANRMFKQGMQDWLQKSWQSTPSEQRPLVIVLYANLVCRTQIRLSRRMLGPSR